MGIPINDIALSNKPVGFLITGINTLKIIKLKKIRRGFFVDVDHGVFMVDSETNVPLMYGKQPIFIYDVRSAKPINLLFAKELDEFCDKNGIVSIAPKHVRQSEKLRGFINKHRPNTKTQLEAIDQSLEELKEIESKDKDDLTEELNRINTTLAKENEQLLMNKQPALEISPEDYATFVLDSLQKKNLITFEEATTLKAKLTSGNITLDDFAKELEAIHKIEINRPLSANAQRYLEYYRAYKPTDVYNYINEAKGLGKDIKELGQPVIRNLLPAKWIVMVIMGVVIGAAVLSTVDLSSIGNLIPFLNR